MVVSISGVVQNPNTYAITGLTLTFSAAPPTGTNNIGVLYLGIPATSVVSPGNTAYLTTTSFTATAGQTTFTPSATYQVGYINVIRNGSQLAPADFTATNGTTVVLNNACVAGDVVVTQGYTLSSIANALPSTGGTVTGATTFNSSVTINGGSASGYTGYKNRIINGGMVIDQRNNGASVNMSATVYPVDRWIAFEDTDGTMTAQRSSVAPAGFINSVLITTTSADSSLAAAQYARIFQSVEGLNVADLAWGTASAATVTLSFWVQSSLTGTFGGSVYNSAFNRSYPFSYTISAANTWEQKTVTIPGDTTGTWLTTNGIGLGINFGLGTGSTFSGTAGAWTGSGLLSPTGAVSVVGTNGATFYVTGVQLERGSNATSFEFRDYGRELIMCQRYLPAWTTGGSASSPFGICSGGGATSAFLPLYYPVTPRVYPSGITVSAVNHWQLAGNTTTNMAFNASSLSFLEVAITVASGLASASAYRCFSNTASAYILATGCEL
jgi:hypothetical protein